MKKFINLKFFAYLIAFIILISTTVILVRAIDYPTPQDVNKGWGIPANSVRLRLEAHVGEGSQLCTFNNQSSINYFIPTKYPFEFLSVNLHKPASLEIECCGNTWCTTVKPYFESITNCPLDCNTVGFCGDGSCNNGETAISCPYDCTYGCCSPLQYTCEGLSQANCISSTSCEWVGTCVNKPSVNPEVCWPIMNENNCINSLCNWDPLASRCYSWCGNNQCDGPIGETSATCPIDCGTASCGDGSCNNGETCSTCSNDCGTCPVCGNGLCDNGENECSCPGDCPSILYNECYSKDPDGSTLCSAYTSAVTCNYDPDCFWPVCPTR